jgi:hypothetical protein
LLAAAQAVVAQPTTTNPQGAAAPAQASKPAASLAEAIAAGKPQLSARARFEQVDEEPFAQDAHASTLRLRLGYESGTWRHASFLVELDHLAALGGESYNSTRNGLASRPIVADPEDTDLNQALLKLAFARDELVLGRQRLNLDNQRFIGNVGWRQNEQTYDAVGWRTKRVPRASVTYAWIGNVNRVFGPDRGTPPGDLRSDSHVLDAVWDFREAGKLSTFAYLLDFESSPALSNRTVGALWSGQVPRGKWKFPWALSYASQGDFGDNPTDYSADYWQLEAGVGREAWSVRVGQEVLTGDATRPERRFQTPLATLHAFQGWADKFLATPPQGIRDTYVAVNLKPAGWDLQLAWHDFGAEAVSRDYGTEWNASLGRRFAKRYDVLVKAARYEADTLATDTTKLWASVAVSFP